MEELQKNSLLISKNLQALLKKLEDAEKKFNINTNNNDKPDQKPKIVLQPRASSNNIKDLVDKTEEVTSSAGVLLISNCKQSKVIAHGTCIKVVIERCQNCEIILDAKLISGLLEIVHSSGIKLTVATKIPTICVDLSDGVSIAFDQQKGAKLEKLFSAKTKSVSIKRDAQAGTLENIEDATDLDVAVQNVSHITSEGKLITEKVIRENGYATTKAEKDKNDERQQRMEKRMEEIIKESIKK